MTIHAILVGIDSYPQNRGAIADLRQGGTNSVRAIRQSLEKVDRTYPKVQIAIDELLNGRATKQAIIQSFRAKFGGAQVKTGDVCLFYFMGHGTRLPAPTPIAKATASPMNEAVLCHDVKPIEDKELLYLFWQAQRKKPQTHFVFISDCCYSGGLTRQANQSGIPLKVDNIFSSPQSLAEYTGGNEIASRNTWLQMCGASFVHMAASQANQAALCGPVRKRNGDYMGYFTSFLTDEISQNPCISYTELNNNIHPFLVSNGQTPQLNGKGISQCFLNLPTRRAFDIALRDGAWVLDAGFLQGIRPSGPGSKTVLQLEDGREVAIRQVFENHSVVEGMQELDQGQVYLALIKQMAIPRQRVVFADGNDAAQEAVLQQALEQQPSLLVDFSSAEEAAHYSIHADRTHFWLAEPGSDAPLFQKIPAIEPWSVLAFLNRLEKVAQWKNTLDLSNPHTSIAPEEIQLQLYKTVEPGNHEEDAPVDALEWWKPEVFRYEQAASEWHPPAFRLRISNAGQRPLWLQALNLSADFSISNRLLKSQQLQPGETAWLTDVFDDFAYKTIPLGIPQAFLDYGISQLDEHIVLLASTTPLNTERLEQKGLPLLPNGAISRELGQPPHLNQPDWTVFRLNLKVEHPALLAK